MIHALIFFGLVGVFVAIIIGLMVLGGYEFNKSGKTQKRKINTF